MATLKYWLWLTNLKGLSPVAAFRLLEFFGTPEGAYFADPAEYELLCDIPRSALEALRDKSLEQTEYILADCDRLGVDILTIQDARYPERLRQLFDPPAVLYIKGKLPPIDEEVAIAVVGAREATPYGLDMAGRLGLQLAGQGATVVSGIARGVDTAALRGALKAGGQVVSVLGNGVDRIYPASNRELYEDVAVAGALVSEYPPGTEPSPRHFPVRNRIISGMALGVVVVEGSQTSGSLITARLSLDQNRDVFAVPGNADAPMSRGPNFLIRQGEAKLVTCGWDVLEEYTDIYPGKIRREGTLLSEIESERLAPAHVQRPVLQEESEKTVDNEPKRTYIDMTEGGAEFTEDERDILVALEGGPLVADDLVEKTQIPARRVFSALTMLQLRGLVEEGPGKRFQTLAIFKAQ